MKKIGLNFLESQEPFQVHLGFLKFWRIVDSTNIKYVDENLANEIVTRFKLYSFSDLLELTQEDLLEIPQVNMKIADLIIKSIKSF